MKNQKTEKNQPTPVKPEPPLCAEDEQREKARATRRLPPLLRRAWYNLNQAFRRRIATTGVTPDQYTILRLLVEGPREGMTQRELCCRMCSDPNTMASLLSRMEGCVLLERRTHESDRRAHSVTISAKGRELFMQLRPIALDLQNTIMKGVPAQRRKQFLADLERIADACQEQLESEPRSPLQRDRQKSVGKPRK